MVAEVVEEMHEERGQAPEPRETAGCRWQGISLVFDAK